MYSQNHDKKNLPFFSNRIEDIDINNVLVSKYQPYGIKKLFKYFIVYNDNDIIITLCIRLPEMTGYARKFDKNVNVF